MGIRISLLLCFICCHLPTLVNAEVPLTAAFIRDHQQWIKKGDQEIQITKNRYVYSPKWSYNGRFIAYIDGDEQGEKSDLFAISADFFKWSYDGKWVSFLATPTASWSNDSKPLCVLSLKGDQFQAVGKMLGYKDWMKWAPSANQLAYISGEGRFSFLFQQKTNLMKILKLWVHI